MRKLLSSPAKMTLSDAENFVYQTSLKFATELSLNLMAIKVTTRPEDFLGWCNELLHLSTKQLNTDLLEPEQFKPLQKLQEILVTGINISQLKMARIAPWPIFVSFIEQQAEIHALDERLRLLTYIEAIRSKPIAEMVEEERLALSGKHTNQLDGSIYSFDVEWFCATKGAKVFQTLLKAQANDFDLALSHIPLKGDVTPTQYQRFVEEYKRIFTHYTVEKTLGEKAPLAPATRLLAMRRPDQFIALNTAKIDVLCQGLSIAKFNNFDFDAYWQDMIGTLRTCAWWHQQEPEEESELKIWQARAILIDLFLHADDTLALSSNYIRLRDKKSEKILNKKNNQHTAKNITKKRTKASAEMLVDAALAAEGIPEYIMNKRDSIINKVKEGKGVDETIALMRAIFG